ncbi:MAG: metallophosphoesterase [Synergistaceae bacterium]|nr:metallophosphoesterase [Synergistaceae bacterium]
MYEILAFGTQYFIWKKLTEAGISRLARRLFAAWGTFWVLAGILAGYDYGHAEYNILPGRLTEILRALSLTWTIISILAFFAFLLVWVLSRFRQFTRRKVFFAVMLALVGTLYCMFEAYYVTARHAEIRTRKLPEGMDRLRLVFISDAHIGGLLTRWHFERVMHLVSESHPDILALTGDTLDGVMTYRERELSMLAEMAEKAKYGAFAINGNHEYYWLLDEDVEKIIRDCGYTLLINERAECQGITIISLDDDLNGWLKPYLKPEDSERFVLVMKHRPGLPFDAEGKFDLQISGHTHGGQFWPLGYFKSMAQKSTQGLSEKAGGYVYVSNGSGFNGPPMRMFTPPEVTVIDIVREE